MQAWDAFLRDLEQVMGKESVDKWLRSFKVSHFDACNLYLEAQNSFQIAWFEEHVAKIASKKLCNNNGHQINVHFESSSQKKGKKEEAPPPLPLEIESDAIDPSSTFTNFLFDEENALLIQFFKELLPGAYNPIFLHGPSGVGKTHLLMAVASALKSQNLSVFYVHAETFTEHVVKAIRNSQMQDFRKIYRNQDVLIIDDVHHLARKNATQEELFHTFNTLHTSGKQILLSSHLPPSRIEEIEPRLISRFEWGILLHLHPLPLKKMKEVIQNRARLHHFPLSDSILDFLLEKFSTSSKSLMRALEALMLRYRSSDPLSLESAEVLLADLIEVEETNQLSKEKILTATSAYFGIREEDILGKSQSKECAFPRKLAMFLCRQELKMAYPAIGRFFRRDHSTVMANIKQIQKKSASQDIETALKEINDLLIKS